MRSHGPSAIAALAQLVEHRIRNVLANIPFFSEMQYLQ
jgi:cephalosporin-C deacetylase-like acetyl esterase